MPSSLPPGPSARFPGDLFLRLTQDRLGLFREMARDHGDVSSITIGRQPLVLLTHPDDIRDVLLTHGRLFTKGRALERAKQLVGEGILTSEGALHLRQRRLVQPAFHRSRLVRYADQMAHWSGALGDGWQDGAEVDINAEMMRLTLNIVAATLFNASVERETADIARAMDDAFDAFDFGYGPLTSLMDRLPTRKRRRFRQARERLDSTIYRMIRERRADPEDRGDLLSMLLTAMDTEGDGGGMSDEQLRDEAITLFLAGHETTANLLSWTWLLLARHPHVEMALHAEVDRVLPGGRLPTMDDLPALPYTRNVLAEVMRLFPPAYAIGRRSTAPYEVRGYTLPARTVVLLPQLFVHRDPRWWPDAETFDPDRWRTPDESRPKFAYFPFGAGTRVCVGEQFAWMEGTLALATLARRWRVHIPGPDPALDPIITLRPKGGMPARLERR